MEVRANPSPPAAWAVFGCTGTSLPPQLLLTVKLITFSLLLMGFPFKLPPPTVPFLPILNHFHPILWQAGVQFVFLFAAIALLCNRNVRFNSFMLGAILLLEILSSRLFYSNGKFYCALVFILTSLERNEGRPWLLHIQLSLIYFGAALNKVLDPDWRNGQYMNSLMNDVVHSEFYASISSRLESWHLAEAMCWSTIVIEALLCVTILLGKHPRRIILSVLLFHTMLLYVTGSFYGTFVPAVAATLFSFVAWPHNIDVHYPKDSNLMQHVQLMFRAVDVDQVCTWHSQDVDSVSVRMSDRGLTGVSAIRQLVLFHPFFYFVFAFFFISPKMDLMYCYLVTSCAWVWYSGVLDRPAKKIIQVMSKC